MMDLTGTDNWEQRTLSATFIEKGNWTADWEENNIRERLFYLRMLSIKACLARFIRSE